MFFLLSLTIKDNIKAVDGMEENILQKMFSDYPMFGWSKLLENIFSRKISSLEMRKTSSTSNIAH